MPIQRLRAFEMPEDRAIFETIVFDRRTILAGGLVLAGTAAVWPAWAAAPAISAVSPDQAGPRAPRPPRAYS